MAPEQFLPVDERRHTKDLSGDRLLGDDPQLFLHLGPAQARTQVLRLQPLVCHDALQHIQVGQVLALSPGGVGQRQAELQGPGIIQKEHCGAQGFQGAEGMGRRPLEGLPQAQGAAGHIGEHGPAPCRRFSRSQEAVGIQQAGINHRSQLPADGAAPGHVPGLSQGQPAVRRDEVEVKADRMQGLSRFGKRCAAPC